MASEPDRSAAPEPMRLVIVYFGPLNVNSAIQAFHFGNDLTDAGWHVTLAAGVGDPEAIREVGEPRFDCVTHHDLPAVLERCRRAPERTIVLRLDPARERPPGDRGVRRPARRAVRGPPRGQRVVPLRRRGRALGRGGAAAARSPSRTGSAPPTLIHPTRSRAVHERAPPASR